MLIACVDAFTDRPFRGNPAGVCLLDAPREDAWMQQVAAEMNLAETAFASPGEGAWSLKWFTPTVEMPLCGHATLATAHLLWSEGRVPPGDVIRFETRSGRLTATRCGDLIELDFPAEPAVERALPPWLADALGERPVWCGQNRLDYIVELESAPAVRRLRPNLEALAGCDRRGVIVTSRSDDPAFDFVSRFFAPAVGIPEDPVTGSAHCCLGPFWGPRLGKRAMVGFQASARGGVVRVRLARPRVVLGGQAVTVHRGSLHC
jgi:predicted PhzF superfamily epimerase YddE/YHI9